jgi:hypothetical protein
MKIDANNQGTWIVKSQSKDEEMFLKFLFDVLDESLGGHHLYINGVEISRDDFLAKCGIYENHNQNK